MSGGPPGTMAMVLMGVVGPNQYQAGAALVDPAVVTETQVDRAGLHRGSGGRVALLQDRVRPRQSR